MNKFTINAIAPIKLGRSIFIALLFFHFGGASALGDPYAPQPKKNMPIVMPDNPFKIGGGVHLNSIEDLPNGIKEIAKRRHTELLNKGYI